MREPKFVTFSRILELEAAVNVVCIQQEKYDRDFNVIMSFIAKTQSHQAKPKVKL